MKKDKLYSILMAVVLCMGFASCSDNDDDNANTSDVPNALIGLWEGAPGGEYWEKRDGKITEQGENNNPLDGCRWEFDTNGKIHVYDYVIVDASYRKDWTEIHSFDYTYSDNKLYITTQKNEIYDIDYEGVQNLSVIDLQETQMILDWHNSYNEDGYQYDYYERWVLQKVNE